MKHHREDENIQKEMMKSAEEAAHHQMRSVGRIIDPINEHEWSLLDGLYRKAEQLACGKVYEPGQVPMTLLMHVPDCYLIQLNMDTVKGMCDQDINKAREIGRLACVACNADAQVLVFEGELTGKMAPEPGSGLRPGALFAVGRTWNSPRERALVMVRGSDGLRVAFAPDWENYDECEANHFSYLLPDNRPTSLEQNAAIDSLRQLGIEVQTPCDKKRELDEKKKREQGRGFQLG